MMIFILCTKKIAYYCYVHKDWAKNTLTSYAIVQLPNVERWQGLTRLMMGGAYLEKKKYQMHCKIFMWEKM